MDGNEVIIMNVPFLSWARFLAVCYFCAAVFVVAAQEPGGREPLRVIVKPEALNTEMLSLSFAPVFKKVAPTVVTVNSTKTVRDQSPLMRDPFFRRFFDFDGQEDDGSRRPRARQEESLGSGVIISPDGYILSNAHVVEGADEIRVVLSDRGEYIAKVIGTDPPTDISVLKIPATNLPAITMTDSDKLNVGDLVLAVGNPFGVGQTVTMGIVSAVGRGGFGIVDYEDFIQTDASINPGNSGGALVDSAGRLVGVPTAILSRTGGNLGIGFAIPVNMARAVMDRVIQEGRVIRGYLGVYVQPLSPDLQKAFKLPDRTGALVGGVMPGSPAAQSGLQEGDVIIEMDGKKITEARQLRLLIAQTPPNQQVSFKVLRDGRERTLTAKLGELKPDQMAEAGERPRQQGRNKSQTALGIEVDDVDARLRRQLELPADVRGAVIAGIDPESPAAAAELRVGEVIVEANRQRVRNAQDFVELARKAGERLLLRVWSNGGSRYVVVEQK
jgi:serine protease Do